MSWLDKNSQIAMLTVIDMQVQAYDTFLNKYGTQALALKHTKIFMEATVLLMNNTNNGGNK